MKVYSILCVGHIHTYKYKLVVEVLSERGGLYIGIWLRGGWD